MASAQKQHKAVSTYLLPVLFCGLLIMLALVRNGQIESPVKAVLQESEPLRLTEQALENYLYSAGIVLEGEALLDESGQAAGTLQLTKGADSGIEAMALAFPLPTYYETGDDVDVLSFLKDAHDRAAQQGEEMFLALFDAIAATDGRVTPRRDSAVEKLRKAMDTGKPSAQAANSWRFSFSLEPGTMEGTVTVLFTLVK